MSRNFPRAAPDHGRHFVPGGETAPDLAPQPLDHFKRGYRERADQRERETEFLNGDFYGSRHSGGRQSSSSAMSMMNEDRRGNNHGGDYRGGGGGGGGGGGFDRRGSGDFGDGGRSQIIMGLDVQGLVDRLCRRDADIFKELDLSRSEYTAVFRSGKAVTAIISNLARRRCLQLANAVWSWVDHVGIEKNTFHYNSMISCCEKVRDYKKAIDLMEEMRQRNVAKNEVTFSSAISACEKCGQWRMALDLLDQMKREGAGQTAIAYNAAISACEKGLVPHKALEIFEQMKREGIKPTVVTYSALISAAEKGQQWKLALEVLEEMKAEGHGANVIAYSAAISACSKGQMWQKALELFREIEAMGGKPSIVTYNATMTALEKGLQWERALDLFDEMKSKNMPVTVVSYGSAISACEKGLQYRQCLEFLDEMTEMGIKKNVIIFGAAMSCMEKSCRADIAFQLMDRMKHEGVAPNVHIYNSAISACARCNLWEKGYELFQEMDVVGVKRDVVTYNAVLDAVCTQVQLGRRLFKEGVELGFYSRVSRLGTQWLELDLHFLSLGGGEIALGWWFEECLVAYLVNTSKLEAVQSISIVTGYGKTRTRGSRLNDDGMRLRVRAMLNHMNIKETPQPNRGRIHIDKSELVSEVVRNGGKIVFDIAGYSKFKSEETTANMYPDVPQVLRPRFRPAGPGEGPPGTLIREGDLVEPQPPLTSEQISAAEMERSDFRRSSYREENDGNGPYGDRRASERDMPGAGRGGSQYEDRRPSHFDDRRGPKFEDRRGPHFEDRKASQHEDRRRPQFEDRRGTQFDDRRGSQFEDRRGPQFEDRRGPQFEDRKGSQFDDRRGSQFDDRRGSQLEDRRESQFEDRRGPQFEDRRGSQFEDRRGSHFEDRRGSQLEDRRGSQFEARRGSQFEDRRGSVQDWDQEPKNGHGNGEYQAARPTYGDNFASQRGSSDVANHQYDRRGSQPEWDNPRADRDRHDRNNEGYEDDRGTRPFHREIHNDINGTDRGFPNRGPSGSYHNADRRHSDQDIAEHRSDGQDFDQRNSRDERAPKRPRSSFQHHGDDGGGFGDFPRQTRASDPSVFGDRHSSGDMPHNVRQNLPPVKEDPDRYDARESDDQMERHRKRGYGEDPKPAVNRGYNIEPAYARKR